MVLGEVMTFYFLVMLLVIVYGSFMVILTVTIHDFNKKNILKSDKIRTNLLYFTVLILLIFWFISFYIFQNIALSLLITLITVVALIDIILTINKANNTGKYLIYYLLMYSVLSLVIYWLCLFVI